MEFRILGPLEVRGGDGAAVPVGGGRQRALLALLLLHAGEVVPADLLVEELWAGSPPASAANALQVYVGGLRKLLDPERAARGSGRTLVTRPPGYLLSLEGHGLDSLRFEQLAERGRMALTDDSAAEAADALRSALGLWRGPALAEFAGEEWAQQEILRLEEARLAAREDLVEAELALGRHRELVPELEALAREEPLRERLRGQLMLALYRSGRQADALEAYRAARRLLVEELGIEPSAALQELERAILRQEPALELVLPGRAELPSRPPTRRPVTALVAELELQDAGGAFLDPEAERPWAQEWARAGSAVIERHGGTGDVLADGSLLGLFGVERVREDDALRAARAADELAREASRLGERLRVDAGAAATFRSGIESGEVLVRPDEVEPQRRVGAALVREATRRRLLAAPGQVVLGERTRSLVAAGAELEPVAPGLWALSAVASEAPAIERHLDAPLVGRAEELRALVDAFDQVERTGECRLLTLLGEPGLGKSRLARELALLVVEERASVAQGASLPYGEAITYRPLLAAVGTLAGDTSAEGIEVALAGVPGAPLVARRLAAALGTAEGVAAPEEVLWAAARLFEAVVRERPLVVVLDDLHWAEPTFLELVERLPESIRGPVLVLALARPELREQRPGWPGQMLMLEPLPEADAELLLERLLDEAGVAASRRLEVAAAAEGNPLFLEQMVALLAERPGADGAVPATIQSLLAARLDLLSPEERELAGQLSVAGREIGDAAVAAVAAVAVPEAERAELLAALVRRRWLASREPDGFRFCHQLLRDACYQALPKQTRAALHARFAAWLEDEASDVTDLDELAGFHLERAARLTGELEPQSMALSELRARASRRLGAAGRRAQARGDIPAAVSLLGRASEVAPDEASERAELLVRLADALRERGEFGAASERAQEALTLARSLGASSAEAQARILALRLQLHTDADLDLERLLHGTDEVLAELERLGDERGLAEGWYLRGWTSWLRCRAATTADALEQALAHATRAGATATIAHVHNLLIGTWLFGPTPVDEAAQRCEQLVADDSTPQRIRASAYRALGGLAAMQGRFAEARSFLEQDQHIVAELGLRVASLVAAEIRAAVELLAGRPAEAEATLRPSIAALERMGETSGVSTLTAVLAEAVHRQGRDEEVVELTEKSRRLAPDEDYSTQVQWRGPRAKALARSGQLKQAATVAAEAVALARETDFLNLHANALLAQAEVAHLAGATDEARRAATEARDLFARKGNTVAANRADEWLLATNDAA